MKSPVVRAPRVVILGCGNPSRGDDALGPLLMARVVDWIEAHRDRPVTAVEDFQLQVEHTLDLRDCDLVLFVDATASGHEGAALHPVRPAAGFSFSSHALSPSALLQAFVTLDHGIPPPAFALTMRGYSFGLGQSLSPRAAQSLEGAWSHIQSLLEEPSRQAWEASCSREAAPGYCEQRAAEIR
ncbi:MAG: hydrogenase maturation protease [Vicinamibacteria bacterium]|nr:hydrogenase maturation protease [Vicinamibacteria bacterium]